MSVLSVGVISKVVLVNMLGKRNFFHIIIDGGSFAFLLLPNLIFLIGWYKWYIGLPISILLVFLFYNFCRTYSRNVSYADLQVPSRLHLLGMLALSIFIAYICGIGEMTYQVTDYVKHNVIFGNLTTEPWPVNVKDPNRPNDFLCYSVGYYLPVALVGKLLGLKSVLAASFLWGVAAIFLCLVWVQRTINLYHWPLVFLFLLFGGLDPINNAFQGQRISWNTIFSWDGMGYPILLSYQSTLRLITWNPQYVAIAWIGTGLLIHFGKYFKNGLGLIALLASASMIWSPFITIGFFPFWIYFAIKNRFKKLIDIYSISGIVLLVIVGLYFAAHEPITDYPNFLWQIGLSRAVHDYTIFIIVEIGVYAILIYLIDRKYKIIGTAFRPFLILSAGVLLILPFYRMGMFNDFLMRVSMPSLFLFSIGVGQAIYVVFIRKLYLKSTVLVSLLAISFAIGSTVGLRYLAMPIWPLDHVAGNGIEDKHSIFGLNELHSGLVVSFQYTGSDKTFYYNYLSNKSPAESKR